MRALTMGLVLAVGASACGDSVVAPLFDIQDVNVMVMEDTPLSVTIPVASNRALTAKVTTQPTHGTLSSSADGRVFTYTPALNYNGQDTVAVTFDNGKETKIGTAHITVTPVDDAPVANPDNFAANFDVAAVYQTSAMLANDTDVDNTTLTVTNVAPITHGQVTMAGTTVNFVPEAQYQGLATFSYTISDGTLTAVGMVTVTVGTNSPPIAVADTVTTPEDTAITIMDATLLANDTDADHQTLTISSVDHGTHGVVTRIPGGTMFVPAPNFNGVASFNYLVTDGAATDTGLVTVNVAPVADPPIAGPDTAFGSEDVPLVLSFATLLGNDSDVDGLPLTISAVSNGVHGTAAIVGSTVVFTGAANYNGPAAFDYTLSDGSPLTATGHVTITLAPVDDPPMPVDDNASGPQDAPITITAVTMLANDIEVDGEPLIVIAVGAPTNGLVSFDGTTATFQPNANFTGNASFKYTVTDGHTNATAIVHVGVGHTNHNPIAVNDAISTLKNTNGTVNALANDSDVDGDVLAIQSVTQGASGSVTFAGAIITYHPNLNFSGNDVFTYTATDGFGGTSTAMVTVRVSDVNDPPSATNDTISTNEDTAVTFDPRINDIDGNGDPLTIISITQPTHGTATFTGTSITYTPVANYNGPDALTYTVTDGHSGNGTATVNITVIPVDDAPVAVGEAYVIDEDTALIVSKANGVLANDTDIDNTTLNAILQTDASHGALSLNADGSFVYMPAANYNGPDLFTYAAFDGLLTSNTVTVNITVNPINDAPVALDDRYDIDVNQPINLFCGGSAKSQQTDTARATTTGTVSVATTTRPTTAIATARNMGKGGMTSSKFIEILPSFGTCGVLINDSDVDGPNYVDPPINSQVLLTASIVSPPSHANSFQLRADGSFSYTPVPGFSGTDSFQYVASDSLLFSRTATVVIVVHPIGETDFYAYNTNDADPFEVGTANPTGNNGNGVLTGQLGGSGKDIGSPITAQLTPDYLDVGTTGTTDEGGTVVLNADGSFTYSPPALFSCDFGFAFTDEKPDANATGDADKAGATVDKMSGLTMTQSAGTHLHPIAGSGSASCVCPDSFNYFATSGGNAVSNWADPTGQDNLNGTTVTLSVTHPCP